MATVTTAVTAPAGNWNYPTAISAGPGRVAELGRACRELGMAAPLLVTDPGLAALPMVGEALERCREAGLACTLFSGVRGNPTGENVQDGVAAYAAGNCDGVIALGGGSALDAGKAIALMAGQSVSLWELEDSGDNWTRADEAAIAPVVAIPTTAGTGSEVGRAAVITHCEQQRKVLIFHPRLLPGRVILDPELSVGLPPQLTAATGMDALSHNLEAFCSPGWHPLADGIALEGMRLVREFLPRAVRNGADLEARQQMLAASAMGATAFQKGLGAMHALAHPLGALYDAHHGLLNAILMPYVLRTNRAAVSERLARAAAYLALPGGGPDDFIAWVLELREEVGIPHRLCEIGIDSGRADQVADMAVADPSAAGNPVSLTAGEYRELFTRAVNGDG